MPGLLTHEVSEIIRQFVIGSGLGTDGGTWPVYADNEPSNPDEVITVYATQGLDFGSQQTDGETMSYEGFQLRIRGKTSSSGYRKARALRNYFEKTLYQAYATVSLDPSAATYYIAACAAPGQVIPLGKESPTSQRYVFTLNVTAPIEEQ